jgi:hypothetical protein
VQCLPTEYMFIEIIENKKRMHQLLSREIIDLKQEFIKKHESTSFIYEVIPVSYSAKLPIEEYILHMLNEFAKNNPLYYKIDNIRVFNIPCKSYEGDINHYWISSKKYDTNYQPFYPTWLLSAYALSLAAKNFGFNEIVDIGSGDGRIAYCGQLLGMKSIGIEIDSELVNLQQRILKSTGVEYKIINDDATNIDYSTLEISKPIFFISGLPELGDMLAINVLEKVKEISDLRQSSGFNFMGSHIMKQYTSDKTKWGWGKIIDEFDLQLIDCLTLPTHWTNEQQYNTPYIYTKM